MLRNFHYIDDKGKDEGVNGMSAYTSYMKSLTLPQSVTDLGNSSNSCQMWRKYAVNAEKLKRTRASTLVLATTACPVCRLVGLEGDTVVLAVTALEVAVAQVTEMVNLPLFLSQSLTLRARNRL